MDDVHHFIDSAKEESYLFIVDSRMRDTAVHPSPSQYEISFNSPFRNVFGLDLLDATVARTEYLVESNTNTLEYCIGQPDSLAAWDMGAWATAARRRTVTLEPGDYNIAQFVEHLNARLREVAAGAGEAALKCSTSTNPAEINNRITLTCSQPFTLLMGSSTVRHTLGFGDPVVSSSAAEYAVVPGWSVNRSAGASDAFLSRPVSMDDEDPLHLTQGPLPLATRVSYVEVYGGRTLRQRFVASATGRPTEVAVYAVGSAPVGQVPPSVEVRILEEGGGVVASGVLTVAADDPDGAYVPCHVPMNTSNTSQLMTAGATYFVEFRVVSGGVSNASTHVGVYYNDDNFPATQGRYMLLDGVPVHAGKNACVDVHATATGHAVTSPGLVNLTGPRYVNIRCPEIESHMFRDRVNERCHAGLGMVSLRGYGFRDQRFDFVSFPARRFHPLGKLSKLTFRLERPDGGLYDSHGVDHTLLLVLRYYRPAAEPFGKQSQLNPQYTPDLRQHLITNKWAGEARANDRIAKFYGP